MAEAPDLTDLAASLRLAANTLTRKAEIAREISALRAEDAALNKVVATWIPRVDDMRHQLAALFQAMPSEDTLLDSVVAAELDRVTKAILDM